MIAVVDRHEAVQILGAGGVVGVPTDTVYGVAASLRHADAVSRIFSLKRRPTNVALPVLVDRLSSIEDLGVTLSENAIKLGDAFWPGALTIVVNVPHELALRVGSPDDTVGFRVPNDELLRQVMAVAGPLVVSSANEHGEPPCHSAGEVLEVFGETGLLDAVLDGGERSGAVSTVVALQGTEWQLLRPGAVHALDVTRVLA